MMGSTKMVVAVKSIIFTLGFLLGASASNSSDLDCEAKRIPVVDGKWQCPDGTVVPFRPLSVYHILDERSNLNVSFIKTLARCMALQLPQNAPYGFGFGTLSEGNGSSDGIFIHTQDISNTNGIETTVTTTPIANENTLSTSLISVLLDESLFRFLGWGVDTEPVKRIILISSMLPVRPVLDAPNTEMGTLMYNFHRFHVNMIYLETVKSNLPDSGGRLSQSDQLTLQALYHLKRGILPSDLTAKFDEDVYLDEYFESIHLQQCGSNESTTTVVTLPTGDSDQKAKNGLSVPGQSETVTEEDTGKSDQSSSKRNKPIQVVAAVIFGAALFGCTVISFVRCRIDKPVVVTRVIPVGQDSQELSPDDSFLQCPDDVEANVPVDRQL